MRTLTYLREHLVHVVILVAWFPFGLFGAFLEQVVGWRRLGDGITTVAAVWAMLAILYGGVLSVALMWHYPFIVPYGLLVVGSTAVSYRTYNFIFPTTRLTLRFAEFRRYKNPALGFLLLTPVLLSVFLFLGQASLDGETVNAFSSSCFQAFAGLLAFVAMFSVFVIERSPHARIVSLLIQSTKGLSILFGLTILLSLGSLILIANHDVIFQIRDTSSMPVAHRALLLATLTFAINSIALAILVFFQVVDVLREEMPLKGRTRRVLFEESRLFQTGKGAECSITVGRTHGSSHLREALEDADFAVAKRTIRPLDHAALQNCDALVLLRTAGDYATSELDAIEKFVARGGGLLLAPGAYDVASKQALAQRFGVTFETGGMLQQSTRRHPKYDPEVPLISQLDRTADPLKNIKEFCLWKACAISDPGSSKVVAWADADAWLEKKGQKPDTSGRFPVLSLLEHGSGRVAFIASHFQWSNGVLGDFDNEELAKGLIAWCTGPRQAGRGDEAAFRES